MNLNETCNNLMIYFQYIKFLHPGLYYRHLKQNPELKNQILDSNQMLLTESEIFQSSKK
ncbi:hypothetical protein pb186bvf_009803 [Paramecium bursaria]